MAVPSPYANRSTPWWTLDPLPPLSIEPDIPLRFSALPKVSQFFLYTRASPSSFGRGSRKKLRDAELARDLGHSGAGIYMKLIDMLLTDLGAGEYCWFFSYGGCRHYHHRGQIG